MHHYDNFRMTHVKSTDWLTRTQWSKATAKRSQHADATYHKNARPNMLRAFCHRVATCCNMFLVLLAQNLTIFKIEPTTQPTCCNISQHFAPNNVAISCAGMLRPFHWGLT